MLILKVLNGPLYGAEITLPTNDCLIRVVDAHQTVVDTEVEHTIDQWAKDTVLTIPLAGPGFNVVIRYGREKSAQSDHQDTADVPLLAEIYTADTGMTEQALTLNTPLSLGPLRIAIRDAQDAWSDAVQCDGRPDAAAAPAADAAVTLPGTSKRHQPFFPLALASAATVACATLLVWLAWPALAPAATLSTQLAGLPCQIVSGSDDRLYVIARDASAVLTIERALGSVPFPKVQIRTRSEEANRIERWLVSKKLPYFAIDLANPRRPVLRLRGAAPVAPSTQDIRSQLLSVVPYAQDVEIRWHSDSDARQAARSLVDEVGAQARFHTTPAHFVVSVTDYLSDAQLDTLGRALAAYRQQWGTQYVEFMINQQDASHLTGVKTGQFAYELHPSRHVYFPSTAS